MGSNFLLVKNLSIASFSDNGPILLMFQWSLIFVSAFKNEPENNTKYRSTRINLHLKE